MKYAVVTFGCRVNQADSLVIEDGLRSRGASASPPEEADLVIVNTCSVTASADQAARQTVRRIARINPRRPRRRDRVLRHAATRRSGRASQRRSVSSPTPRRTRGRRSCSATATVRAATAWRQALRGARRSRCACRRDAMRRAATASSRDARVAGRSRPLAAVAARYSPRHRRGLQGNRHHRRPPRVVRARPRRGLVAGDAGSHARRLE